MYNNMLEYFTDNENINDIENKKNKSQTMKFVDNYKNIIIYLFLILLIIALILLFRQKIIN